MTTIINQDQREGNLIIPQTTWWIIIVNDYVHCGNVTCADYTACE